MIINIAEFQHDKAQNDKHRAMCKLSIGSQEHTCCGVGEHISDAIEGMAEQIDKVINQAQENKLLALEQSNGELFHLYDDVLFFREWSVLKMFRRWLMSNGFPQMPAVITAYENVPRGGRIYQ